MSDDELTPSERIDARITGSPPRTPPHLTPQHAFQRPEDEAPWRCPVCGGPGVTATHCQDGHPLVWKVIRPEAQAIDVTPNWSPEERARAARRVLLVFEPQLQAVPMGLALELCQVAVSFVLDRLGEDPLSTDPEEAAEAHRDPGSVQALLRGELEAPVQERSGWPITGKKCLECDEFMYQIPHPGDSWHYECPNGHTQIVGK